MYHAKQHRGISSKRMGGKPLKLRDGGIRASFLTSLPQRDRIMSPIEGENASISSDVLVQHIQTPAPMRESQFRSSSRRKRPAKKARRLESGVDRRKKNRRDMTDKIIPIRRKELQANVVNHKNGVKDFIRMSSGGGGPNLISTGSSQTV